MLYHSFHSRTQLELEQQYLKKRVQVRRTNGRRQTGRVVLVSALERKVVVALDTAAHETDTFTVPIDTLHRYHTWCERVVSWWQRRRMAETSMNDR
jgi:hypothetical protein